MFWPLALGCSLAAAIGVCQQAPESLSGAQQTTPVPSNPTAAQPPDERQTPVLHVEVRRVLVDIVVTVAKGKHLHDLSHDDFRLDENRTPRKTPGYSAPLVLSDSGVDA
jgi:hypothetical protein